MLIVLLSSGYLLVCIQDLLHLFNITPYDFIYAVIPCNIQMLNEKKKLNHSFKTPFYQTLSSKIIYCITDDLSKTGTHEFHTMGIRARKPKCVKSLKTPTKFHNYGSKLAY